MNATVLTPEQCGEMLFEWVRNHCNSTSAKSVARDAGYKYSIFSPAKKLRLFEECLFMFVSLAVHGANGALGSNSAIEATVDAFLEKTRTTILNSMASGDDDFQNRYASRVGSYFELLRSGGDPIGVSGEFLVGLFGTPNARLKLEAGLKLMARVAAAQASLRRLFEQVEVRKSCAI